MSFDYVWAVIGLNGTPPSGKKLHLQQNDYKYYPFEHTEEILTIDYSLWGFAKEEDESSRVAVTHFPDPSTISQFIDKDISLAMWRLVAFCDSPVARTIDPANSMPLSKIPSAAANQLSARFIAIGFDVIDLSGLSALTNVGFTTSDMSSFSGINIDINQYGLIATANGGQKYADFASLAAAEHAPFFPVEIWMANRVEPA